jgi:hypothetical protein
VWFKDKYYCEALGVVLPKDELDRDSVCISLGRSGGALRIVSVKPSEEVHVTSS